MYSSRTIKHQNGMKVLVWGMVFLCVLCVAGSFSAAQEGEGESEPIPIATIEELQKIGNDPGYPLNGSYVLTQDIDAAVTATWNDGEGFSPIGNFSGTFDGQGHKIMGLTINRPDDYWVGLFADIETDGSVKNVGIDGGAVSGDSPVGGLVGENGGVITSCYATCVVTGDGGGGWGYYGVGGLVGNNDGMVALCYATGAVTGDKYVGGLVGHNDGGAIKSCYATGEVTGDPHGGLVGENDSGTITSCYATGVVTGNYGGGLTGNDYNGTIALCYWDIETSGKSGSSGGGRGLTTEQMQTIANFGNANWDQYDWVMVAGSYPRLNWEGLGWPAIPSSPIPFAGSGTEADPYLITSAAEFALLSQYAAILGAHIRLTTDLDLSGMTLYPIGDLGPLTGVFDGNSHVLRNAVIHWPNTNNVGLFGIIDSAVIRNLGVEAVDVVGDNTVGGLVGINDDGIITSCYVTGAVTGDYSVGGLVAENGMGTITSCYATCAVTGNNTVGGLVGYNWYEANITSCYATGAVTGDDGVGGLVGYNEMANVTSCYWDTETSGQLVSEGGMGLSTIPMMQQNSYAGWDFSGVWGIDEGKSYPYLLIFGQPVEGEGEPVEGEPIEGELPETVTLSFDDMDLPSGACAPLGLNISDISGVQLTGFEISFTFDAAVIDGETLEVQKTVLSRDFSVDVQTDPSGEVSITATSSTPITLAGAGRLFLINCCTRTDAAQGACGELACTSASFTFADGLTIGTDLSDKGSVCVNGECGVPGDVNKNALINREDAETVLDIAVRKIEATPCHWKSGELNGDKRLDCADAVIILRMEAGNNIAPADNDQTLADVWETIPSDVTVSVSLPYEVNAAPGDLVQMPVTIKNGNGLAGLDMTVTFPPDTAGVTLEEYAQSAPVSDFANRSLQDSRFLRVGMASNVPLAPEKAADTEVLMLKFRVAEDAAAGTQFQVNFEGVKLAGAFGENFDWYTDVVPLGGTIKVIAAPEEGDLKEMAQTLLDGFDTADTNGDSVLNYDEARAVSSTLTQAQFTTLDANADGKLTKDELEAYLGDIDKRCGCCKRTGDGKDLFKRYLGDWLLVGLSAMILLAYFSKHKQM